MGKDKPMAVCDTLPGGEVPQPAGYTHKRCRVGCGGCPEMTVCIPTTGRPVGRVAGAKHERCGSRKLRETSSTMRP
jgi:hypothetical protein